MVIEKIKELHKLEAEAEKLKKAIEVQRTRELPALPARYGYDSVDQLIKAIKAAVKNAAPKAKPVRKAKGATSAVKRSKGGKRTRTKITPELSAKVVAAARAGRTGGSIAREFGISLPSVQNIKKKAGLVKARAPKSAPAPAPAPMPPPPTS